MVEPSAGRARGAAQALAVRRRPQSLPIDAARPAARTAALDEDSVATAGFAQEVATRADLQELLADVRDLPDEQRAALVLSELGGLSHADIAEVIERKETDVKALVFRARSALIDWRQARETPCEEVREQLADLRGGSLRRRWLSRHLQSCAGCREFKGQVKAQRRMLALVIPVVPQLGFKESVLAAAGLGSGSAGGAVAAAGLGGAAAISGTVAKVAVVGALAGGALTVGERAIDRDPEPRVRDAAPAAQGRGLPSGADREAAPARARRPPQGRVRRSVGARQSRVPHGPGATARQPQVVPGPFLLLRLVPRCALRARRRRPAACAGGWPRRNPAWAPARARARPAGPSALPEAVPARHERRRRPRTRPPKTRRPKTRPPRPRSRTRP